MGENMKTKRITLTITGNVDSVKKDIEDRLGVELSYAQVIDYLIHYYRKHNKPATSWQKQSPTPG